MGRTPRAAPARRGAATAERILDVSERLFADRGYGGTSLRAIAAEVGVQNPSLYKHFPSKAALYEAVLERALDPILNELWDADDEIARVMRHLAEHPAVAKLMQRELTAGGDGASPGAARWMAAIVARTERFQPTVPVRDADFVPLRVLAICHVVAGYFASAATYQKLTGRDLFAESALAQQSQIVAAVSEALFADAADTGAQS